MARTGKVNTKRMTADDFDVVSALLPSLSGKRLQAARAVLVDGATYQASADRFGGTRQGIYKATRTVWMAYEHYQVAKLVEHSAYLPEGWVRVQIEGPVELIEKFRDEVRAYAAMAGDGEKHSAGSHKKSDSRKESRIKRQRVA